MFFWGRQQRESGIFITLYQECMLSTWYITAAKWLRCKVTFPPFSVLYFLEGSHYGQPTIKEWMVTIYLLEGRVSTNGIWTSAQICFFFPIYVIIYLYHDKLIDIYFKLWIIIQYCYLSCSPCSRFCHLELFLLAPVSLSHTPCHCIYVYFITFLLLVLPGVPGSPCILPLQP